MSSETRWNSTPTRRPSCNASGSQPMIGAHHPEPLVEPDHRGGVRHLEGGVGWPPDHRPAVERALPGALFPHGGGRVALGAHAEGAEAAERALRATLVEQPVAPAPFPVGLAARGWAGGAGIPSGCGSRTLMGVPARGGGRRRRGRPSLRSSTARPRRPRPGSWHMTPHLLGGPDDPLQLLRVDSRMAERHGPAVGGHRKVCAGSDVAVLDERAAFPGRAEAECLELPDDLERERIVELGHVDIAGREAGHGKGDVGPPGRRPARPGRSRRGAESPTPGRRRRPVRRRRWHHRGSRRVPRTRRPGSAVVRTRAQPPSDVMAHSSRWKGSAIMREARMSAGENGPRP